MTLTKIVYYILKLLITSPSAIFQFFSGKKKFTQGLREGLSSNGLSDHQVDLISTEVERFLSVKQFLEMNRSENQKMDA